jgi:hypothetical protein
MKNNNILLIGILLIIIMLIIIIIKWNKIKTFFLSTNLPNLPNNCDPNKPGYTKSGIKDSYCGNVSCDPNKKGYDINGFPDLNCDF